MTTMPFGKYKGQRLDRIPENYLRWFYHNADHASPKLRRAVGQILQVESPLRASAVRGIDVDKWFRKLAIRHHPDHGGSVDAMKAIEDARRLLEEMIG